MKVTQSTPSEYTSCDYHVTIMLISEHTTQATILEGNVMFLTPNGLPCPGSLMHSHGELSNTYF